MRRNLLSHGLEAGSLGSGCRQGGCAPSEAPGEGPSCLSSLWWPHAPGLVATSLQSLPACVGVGVPPSSDEDAIIGFGR